MRDGITNNRQLQTGNLNSELSGYIRKKKNYQQQLRQSIQEWTKQNL